MDKLILVLPTIADSQAILEYRDEFISAGETICGAGDLTRLADPQAWLATIKAKSSQDTLPVGLVISTQFICKRLTDGKILGTIDVRHSLNDYLLNYGGNIGYAVAPSQRHQGIAKWMLQSVLTYCREIGLPRVLVTCLADNVASRKTILACGGEYEDSRLEPNKQKLMQRYWIKLA